MDETKETSCREEQETDGMESRQQQTVDMGSATIKTKDGILISASGTCLGAGITLKFSTAYL